MTSVSEKPGDGDAPVLRQLSVRAVVEVFLRTARFHARTSPRSPACPNKRHPRSSAIWRSGDWRVPPDAAAGVVLGVDLGATNTRLALADLRGGLMGEIEAPTDRRGGNEALERLAASRRDLVARVGFDPGRVRGAAVAVPGSE